MLSAWRDDYNRHRPHSKLGWLTPASYAARWSLPATILGAFPVALNWHWRPDEAWHVLEDCGAEALIIYADFFDQFSPSLPAGRRVLVVATPTEICEAYVAT